MDVFPYKVTVDNFFLFADWLASSINLLQYCLHKTGLAFCKHFHFVNSLVVHLRSVLESWWLQAMYDSICILIFPFLQMPLNLLWVERLETIWLKLETFIEILQILYVILYSLRPLLFNSQISFITKCLCSNALAIKVLVGRKCQCFLM